MKEIKYAVTSDFSCRDLGEELKKFFEKKRMQSQCIENDSNHFVVQGKTKDSYIRKIAGMEKACTVSLKEYDNILYVQIGEGKWFDKMAGAAIAWFVAWPVAVTAAYGTFKQTQLPKEIDAFIQMYLGNEPMNYLSADEQETKSQFCPLCGEQRFGDAKFCQNCGTQF